MQLLLISSFQTLACISLAFTCQAQLLTSPVLGCCPALPTEQLTESARMLFKTFTYVTVQLR